jgi:hypothetical protein
MTKPRQAVIIIHGIGEQRPMETLRAFMLGVLGSAPAQGEKPLFYSKPDLNAEGYELRRYRAFDADEDSDFIEFYWQHLMPVGSWAFILTWLWSLMRRPAKAMPRRFLVLWWVCWLALAGIAAGTVVGGIAAWIGAPIAWLTLPSLTGTAAIVAGVLGTVVRSFVGDAAIYLNPGARTVDARNKIRASGMALLERIQKDGRYDRIVIVGHSLGSVIGYDILNFAWQRASDTFRRKVEAGGIPVGEAQQPALAAAEALAADGTVSPEARRSATRALHAEQRTLGVQWLVTDFVTLGSPLAHATLLLARGPKDLERRTEERELPTSPPLREDGTHFAYRRTGRVKDPAEPNNPGQLASARVVDHAAVFAVTAWTNLYFPCRILFYGDLVGGPISPVLGPGIIDCSVETSIRSGWLAHTEYWTRYLDMPTNAAPLVLAKTLDLQRKTF